MRRVAVVGAGISGLATAWQLGGPDGRADFQVTLFESGATLGGHAHTVDVTLPDASGRPVTHGVDTGFLVFNPRTYPNLVRLFDQLQVPLAASDMSFSVQSVADGLEWSGSNLDGVFAQRRNLLRPAFLGMLRELLRFNRLTTALAEGGGDQTLAQSIGDFLDENRFGDAFRRWYLLPMIGCIWSCPTEQMLRFPIGTLIRFCHNHGLLQVNDRPQWHTVSGGSREYVQRMRAQLGTVRLATPVQAVRRLDAGGVQVHSAHGSERFDEVVFACHSDQALRILGDDASPAEREVLGAIAYHPNRAVLHTDVSLLPRRPRAWAAWNYEHGGDGGESSAVCLHYLINRLQPLPFAQPVIVSLNPVRPPRPDQVLGTYDYAHPVFDLAAIEAQRRVPSLQGQRHTWFCGAWTGYGFHEDGLKSGLAVAGALRATIDPARAAPAERLAA
ncbi:NAD(P)/FAD-dependent oxidoreductase [Sphaerotilus mobilis]|uniref:Putative NAD/FAD-binding protein n=1 Tax=Sphaerotilus mobilis TaxID=47994 RepID=A0A4V2EUZ2_9BURK|nr:FAD-dependent oxidoreductase [Sphaerotilus mobilis]RZS46893.1 putative NAD/FAD-binding protein [Sphaerotilus mobilis]